MPDVGKKKYYFYFYRMHFVSTLSMALKELSAGSRYRILLASIGFVNFSSHQKVIFICCYTSGAIMVKIALI